MSWNYVDYTTIQIKGGTKTYACGNLKKYMK